MEDEDLFNFWDRAPAPPALPSGRTPSPEIEALRQRAATLAAGAKADNTRLAYRKGWRAYRA